MNTNNEDLVLPPGNLGLPIIGETLSFLNDPKFASKRTKKYGKTFKTNIFGKNTVVISGAEENRFLLMNENKYFSTTWPPSTKILLGEDSFAIKTGEEHQQRRKLLFQAFQPRVLSGYVPKMQKIAQSYLEKWVKLGNLTWYPELRNYTFDTACKLLIGIDYASQSDLFEWFEIWGQGLFRLPVNLPWTKFGKAMKCREKMLKEIEKIILKRQQETSDESDALGILLQAKDEDGKSLSLQELKDQVLLLLFAGHETLTSAIASFCLLLAQQGEVLKKVREEQAKINIEGELTIENLKSMTYLDQVLKEVLRLVPPVGGGFRDVINTCELGGYLIPKGWGVLYQIGVTHSDQNIYTQPQQFDPDRFNPERGEDQSKTFGYLPFGGGIRECLGKEFARLEMKIFAALLIRNYDWELLPDQDLSMIANPTPHPRDGLKVHIKLYQK